MKVFKQLRTKVVDDARELLRQPLPRQLDLAQLLLVARGKVDDERRERLEDVHGCLSELEGGNGEEGETDEDVGRNPAADGG